MSFYDKESQPSRFIVELGMKFKIGFWLMCVALIQGCGSDGLLEDDKDTNPLSPRLPQSVAPGAYQPSPGVEVITTDSDAIYDTSGQAILMRGTNITFAENPTERIKGIAAAKSVGANIVRIQLTKNTSANELQTALDQVVEQQLIAMLVFDGPEGEIECTRSETHVLAAVEDYWLDRWIPVISQDKYQPHLMINIANKWGPQSIFSAAASLSYGEYVEAYKYFIQQFRLAGLNMPLVIDAPGCGQDHFAFMGGRAAQLLASDKLNNLILSVHAFGDAWNSRQDIQTNINDLQDLPVPFLITEFGGSEVEGDFPMDHKTFLELAAGNYAATLNLPWESSDDVVSFSYPLEREVSGIEEILRMDVRIPQIYVDDGNLSLQMFLRDANGDVGLYEETFASTKAHNRWNRLFAIAYDLSEFTETTGSFTGENITHVGLKIEANGKAPDVRGSIKVDNIVFGGPLDPLYAADFSFDAGGWKRIWGAPVNTGLGIYQENGVLNILADWSAEQNNIVFGYDQAYALDPAVDVNDPFVVSFDVFIPLEYAVEEDFTIQPFFVDNTNDRVFAGLDWITSDSGRFEFGEWNSILVEMPDFRSYILGGDFYEGNDNFNFNAGISQIGIQLANINSAKQEPVQIDNIVVDRLESLSVGGVVKYSASFDSDKDGWGRGMGLPATDAQVYQVDGALAIHPDWGDGGNSIGMQHNLSLVEAQLIESGYPITIRYRMFIPEEYGSESNLAVQTYINGSAGPDSDSGWNTWQGFVGVNWRHVSAINLGGWTEIVLNINEFTQPPLNYVSPDFDAANPFKAVGMQFVNIESPKSAPILLDDFSIEVVYPTGDSSLDIEFETLDALEPFAIEQNAGLTTSSWTAVFGDNVKELSYGLEPLGWISWVWMDDDAGWNLSNLEGFVDDDNPASGVDLTGRGTEIIEGPGGISETSHIISFE